MKKIILILLVGIFLLGCTDQQAENKTPEQPGEPTVSFGNTVELDYVLRFENSTLIETTIGSVAKEEGVYREGFNYAPFSPKISFDGSLIPGFEKGLIGMKEGESKIIKVDPEEGYGVYDPSKNLIIERFYNQSKFEEVPIEELKKNNVHIAKDFVIKTNAGMLIINEVKNNTVILEYLLKVNDTFEFNGLPQKIIGERNGTFMIKIDAEKGNIYQSTGPTGVPTSMLIKEVTEDTIITEGNHPLAGKTLYFNVTIRKIN